jgi:hypothetical protein
MFFKLINPGGYRNCNNRTSKSKSCLKTKKVDCAFKTNPTRGLITALVLTRTIKFICLSRFLQVLPSWQIPLNLKPGRRTNALNQTPVPWLKTGSVQNCTATLHRCAFWKFLHHDSQPVTYYTCTATLVYARKFVPWRQKPRHASLIPAGARTLPRDSFSAPAFIRSATQTHFIAGPLAVKWTDYYDTRFRVDS